MMAVTQIRQPETMGRGYYERTRLEGKTPREAMRCLKRRLSDLVYWQLVADRRATITQCKSATTPTRTRPTSTSAATPVPRTAPLRRPPPDGVDGFVALDWEDGRIVGIEILDASSRLTQDILDEAEHAS